MTQTDRIMVMGKIFAAAWWRGRWSCSVAGGFLSFFAIAACIVVLGGTELPGLSRESIGTVMRLEGYAFGTGFLLAVLLPWCISSDGPTAGCLWVAFLVTIGLMSAALWSTHPGWILMFQYLIQVGMTYLGALLDPRGAFSTSAWWQRVLTIIVLFVVGVSIFNTPQRIDSWGSESSVMHLAVFYFCLMALAEWSGIYQMKRADWAAFREAWRRH